ncbi:hypothetical protein [Xanthocytophaga agilis]|uniref:Uncharacterized protein n=1 Tax=Xanthocytophaga agilis TaxID=3048010 RepID=A0AAE3UJD7_9BACT|nr:hypothetical protein [Xanthocytophaga agilis]MDJ1505008.1 hypothetical protein [Xanthocytophaga agilis]
MFSINLPNPFGGKNSNPQGTNHTPLAVGLLVILLLVGLYIVFQNPKST